MPDDIPQEKHDHHTLEFPDNFLWGAATAAHQVEGNNFNSDWWQWEQTQEPNKRSGMAADQYHLYEQDFTLAKDLNHNAHRLSIEWARIEPEEGKFDQSEIDHYIQVLKSLKAKNMQVMLTLYHFTLPNWVAEKGGWENSQTAGYFERFLKTVIPQIKEDVDLWITINEPQVIAFMGYIIGAWPPQKRNNWRAFWVTYNLAQAHKKAYKLLHQLVPGAQVGISHNAASYSAFHKHSLRELLTGWFFDLANNHLFYKLTGMKVHDFIGLNYYFNWYISFNGERKHLPSVVDIAKTKKDVSDMGWEIYPDGIFNVIMDFSDYHLPIYITENGLASTNDDRRCRFLISYLKEIYHSIHAGANVKGYFHWSLIDNFEWADGFKPRFGLIEIDYRTLKRTPRPSAYVYKDIIAHNGIHHNLMRFIGHTVKAEEVLDKEYRQH